MNDLYPLLGRAGLSLILILSGWGKIAAYAGAQQYMDAIGVPGALLPLVIALELGGGLAILAGVFTRWIALAFAAFALAAGVLFHWDFADQAQFTSLVGNAAIAGGFLLLAATGAGAFSLDALRSGRDPGRPLPAGGHA